MALASRFDGRARGITRGVYVLTVQLTAFALLGAAMLTACGDSSSGGLKFRTTPDGGVTPGSGGSVSPGDDAGDGTGGAGAGGRNTGGGGGAPGPCVTNGDCGPSEECLRGTCAPVVTCKNSRDCGTQVCDPASHRCVDCASAADCDPGAICAANRCRTQTACTSDKQCTPLGQLCDTSLGQCVDCVTDTDCADADHCTSGVCVTDVCIPGQSGCDSGSIVTCLPSGAFSDPAPCGARETCQKKSTTASCAPWVCDAGVDSCQGETAVTCSPDGLTIVSSTDCTKTGQHCFQGKCGTQKCVPNSLFCNGDVVEQCDGTGQTSTPYATCDTGEYCDTVTSACKPRVCTPNAPSCDGTRATTCNATGSGYATGGQECAPSLSCAAGKCVSCGASGGSQKLVRMSEVMIGTPEYIVLENRGTCPVDLGGMMLSFDTSYVSGIPSTYTLPPRVLAPGAKVFVLDDTATPQGDDILSDINIDWQGAYGGTALLCAGDCATVANVVDALSYFGGQAPPALPAPVTFAAPLTQITTSNEQTTSFVRSAFSGAYPAFKASDWSTATATRQGSNGTTCPVTQPAVGTFCTAFGLSCPYGNVTCSCSLTTITWACQ